MIYLNIKTTDLRRGEVIGSEPTERATWLFLQAYCVEQENSGRIEACGDWKDRQWQQTCGVTLEEVKTISQLWEWDGPDLIVHFYPIEKQEEVQAKRRAGQKGGKKSGKSRKQSAKQQRERTSSSASSTASTEGKVKEEESNRNGKEDTPHTPLPGGGGVCVELEKATAEADAAALPSAECPYKEMVDSFNAVLGERLRKVIYPEPKRKAEMVKLWVFLGAKMDNVNIYWKRVKRSKYLMGYVSGKSWRASFDWLLDTNNAVKVMERHYDNEGRDA